MKQQNINSLTHCLQNFATSIFSTPLPLIWNIINPTSLFESSYIYEKITVTQQVRKSATHFISSKCI
jgi:hypothetical protein